MQRIYEAAADLIRAGRRADPVTLKSYFEQDTTLNEIGGPAYLARLAAAATTIINTEEYGRLVYELATRRRLISIGGDIVNESFEPKVDQTARELIERAEQALYEIAETGKYGQGFLPFGTALTEAIDMAAAAYQRDGGLSGISCGLKDIDEKMGGLQPSDLIILAGRPAMGKTALATNVAYRVASSYKSTHNPDGSVKVTDGGVVAFFSLEMSAEQLATRIISEQAEIASERIRRGKIGEDEFHRLVEVSRELPVAAALYRRDRRPDHRPARGAGAAAEAAARAGPGRGRLSAALDRLLPPSAGRPGPGSVGDHHRPQGPRQGAQRADPGAVAAVAPGRNRATTSARSWPTSANPARSSRMPTSCSSSSVRNIIWRAASPSRALRNISPGRMR